MNRGSDVLAQLTAAGLRVQADGDALRIKGPLTRELRDLARAHKAEIMALLSAPLPLAQRLEAEVRRARSWGDLERVVDAAQAGYEAGELSNEEAYRLAVLAGQESQVVPGP